MTRTIALPYGARLEFHDWGCRTVYEDGTFADSVPHPGNIHYSVIAHRCGYGDDLMAYCVEHDLAHSLVSHWLTKSQSAVLWGLAHEKPLSPRAAAYEEMVAQAAQRWWRANERPIIGGCNWDSWKAEALRMLEASGD